MERDQNAGTNNENEEVSYADRGEDNIGDLGRSDANAMDRAAQAGTTGAFGQGDATDAQQRREDAEDAFGDNH